MKKFLLLSGVFAASIMNAQNSASNGSEVLYPVDFHISKPLRDMPDFKESDNIEDMDEAKDGDHRALRAQKVDFTEEKDGPDYGNNQLSVQSTMGNRSMAAVIVGFAGQAGGGYPPDPSGAVGPNHYVQAVNATPFKVYGKTGATLMASKNIGALWSPATGNMGDPICMYDKYADRWFLAQFGQGGSTNYVYIAISTTPDPTGTYYTYTFTSSQFPDYLKFNIWHDGYYMTSNQGGRLYVFERSQMLAGVATARAVTSTFTVGGTSGFWCPLAADADGGLPPSGTPCPFFWYTDNSWSGAVDGVKYCKATVNWGTTATLSVSSATQITTSAFNGTYNSGWNDIPQPNLITCTGTITTSTSSTTVTGVGTSFTTNLAAGDFLMTSAGAEIGQIANIASATSLTLSSVAASANSAITFKKMKLLDGIGGVATYRAQYRRWAGYNTVVLNWGVLMSSVPRRRAIKWVELRELTAGVWTLYQEGIYDPDASSRWVGSIAMDDNGSIALCYAKASSATGGYPSLAFTGRLATDPPGQMTFTETVAKLGTASQTSANRFGDYSQTTIDVDGLTFWHTGEYIGGTTTAGSPRTWIYSFKLPLPTTGIEESQSTANSVNAYQSDGEIKVTAENLSVDGEMAVDIFDVTGKQITGKQVMTNGNKLETSLPTDNLSSGTYLVRVAKMNASFQRIIKIAVTK